MEAAIVVSVTFLVLSSLIICTFYLHDRVILQSAACEAAAEASIFATQEERSEAAADAKKRVTASLLLGSRNLDGYTAAGSKESKASWNAQYPVPGFAAKYLAGNQLNISTSWACKIIDPADTIRKIRGASELLTGGDN